MKYFLIPAAAVCAALFAGCASQPSEEKALDFPAPSVTLTIQESGDAVPLRVGQYAKITLKENPTTGYSWYFKLDNGKRGPQPKSGQAVELVGERYLASNTRLAGAPGRSTWSATASGSGRRIRSRNRRSATGST